MYLFCADAMQLFFIVFLYLYRQELYQGKGLPRAQSYWIEKFKEMQDKV